MSGSGIGSYSSKKIHCCSQCKKSFSAWDRLQNHVRASHSASQSTAYASTLLIRDAYRCKYRGESRFWSEDALRDHCNMVYRTNSLGKFAKKWACHACNTEFPATTLLQHHKRSRQHCYYSICDVTFSSLATETQHLRLYHHQYHCCDCDADFTREEALEKHSCQKIRKSIPLPNNIRKATNKDNKPPKYLQCAASIKCKRKFGSPSALLSHMESGTCVSGISRKAINDFVRTNDTERLIIDDVLGNNPINEVVGSSSDLTSSFVTPIMTPTLSASSGFLPPSGIGLNPHHMSTDGILALTRMKLLAFEVAGLPCDPSTPRAASELSFSSQYTPSSSGILTATSTQMSTSLQLPAQGSTLRCPLCPNRSRVFVTIAAVEAHLVSPAHEPKIYHCPVALLGPISKGTMVRRFTTLSGLTAHLESGACGEDGAATLEKAMAFVQERLDAFGFGKVRLVK